MRRASLRGVHQAYLLRESSIFPQPPVSRSTHRETFARSRMDWTLNQHDSASGMPCSEQLYTNAPTVSNMTHILSHLERGVRHATRDASGLRHVDACKEAAGEHITSKAKREHISLQRSQSTYTLYLDSLGAWGPARTYLRYGTLARGSDSLPDSGPAAGATCRSADQRIGRSNVGRGRQKLAEERRSCGEVSYVEVGPGRERECVDARISETGGNMETGIRDQDEFTLCEVLRYFPRCC